MPGILRHLLLITCLLRWTGLSAQCPEAVKLNITGTLYNQENGLPSNMLMDIASDSIGYRYFLGVDGNWIRYDGTNFTVKENYKNVFFNRLSFNESESYIRQRIGGLSYKKMNADDRSLLWRLEDDSLICFDRLTNKKEIFALPGDIGTHDGNSLFPSENNCWISTQSKIYRFDLSSRSFKEILVDPIQMGKHTGAWYPFIFRGVGGQVFLLKGGSIFKLNKDLFFEKFAVFDANQIPVGLFELIADRYLFVNVNNNSVVYEIDLTDGSSISVDLADHVHIHNSSALKIMSLKSYRDYLLIGTSNAGLFIYNHCTHSMQQYQYNKQSGEEELTNAVAWIAVDDENVVWMQTETGLIKLEINRRQVNTYLPSSAKSGEACNNCNNVRTFFSMDGELFIGTLEGVYRLDLSSMQMEILPSPSTTQPVWSDQAIGAIAGDQQGNVFIGSWSGGEVLLWNERIKKTHTVYKPDFSRGSNYHILRSLFYDSHHVLWIGINEGIVRIYNFDEFYKNNFSGKLNVNYGLNGISRTGTCFAINEDIEGNIWLGCLEGLFRYNSKTGLVSRFVNKPGDPSSISDNQVRSIHCSADGNIWIGTNSGGLNRFNSASQTFTSFTMENGLPNNSIYTILEDEKGFLWLGTNAGLCRFGKVDHSIRTFTPRDGIQNYEFNTNAAAVLPGGRLCFGGRAGFNIFHPDSMNVLFSIPRVTITRFKIFDREFPVTNSTLELPHDQNTFTFDFSALSYYRSNDNQYAYMMEGADKDWIKSGSRQYTSYTNLPPGTYKFKVKAANYSGVWSQDFASVIFVIHPAWYSTLLFRVAVMGLIAATIYILYRYRLKQMMKLQAIRNRIASDLHDEIGSTLSSISLSSTVIQSKLNGNNAEVTKLLKQVSNNTDSMMEALSDIVWAINTQNDRFDNVMNRMRAFAIEVLEPANITVQFSIGEHVSDVHLDMQQRKNIYLIFKEAVNNSVKYSGSRNVWVTITGSNKTFSLTIKDDGKGFDKIIMNGEQKSLSGNGIRNMKKRAEELGGNMTIDSVPGEGVQLNLRFTI